jgi:hypothetical protein
MGRLATVVVAAASGICACSSSGDRSTASGGHDAGSFVARDAGGTAIASTGPPKLTPPGTHGLASDAGPVDAGDDAGEDSGFPVRLDPDASWTIAVPTNMPSVVDGNGPVLSSATFQAVTFADYDLTTDVDAFVGTVGSTPYWRAAVAEYGVGPPTIAAPAHIATGAPPQLDDSAIQAWLASELTSGADLAPPSPGSVYVLFYPSATTIYFDGQESCFTIGGYHSSTIVAGTTIVYAVVPECASQDQDRTVLQATTSAASHEMIEAVTDPLALTGTPAYSGVDPGHLYDQILLGGGEIADLCAQWPASFFVPGGFPYMVQRVWSNASAAAGLDPCQPELPGETYFNAVPTLTDSVHIVNGSLTAATLGASIAPGASKVVDVQLYSEADIGPWTVQAVGVPAGSANLSFSWDRTTGTNGETLHLTITVNAVDPNYGGEPFLIESQLDAATNYWLGYVGQ